MCLHSWHIKDHTHQFIMFIIANLLIFSPVFFPRTFSNVATFEIQRFKLSVSCFSSTCRYNTVHVPCGISIQTSPVWFTWTGGVRACAIGRDQT